MSTKVICRRAEVFVLAEVYLPRRPHAVLPRSQVLSEKRKWRRTLEGWWILIFNQTSDRGWPLCGRLEKQTSARTKTSVRLKITFVDMTYPGQRPEPPSLSPHFLLLKASLVQLSFTYVSSWMPRTDFKWRLVFLRVFQVEIAFYTRISRPTRKLAG